MCQLDFINCVHSNSKTNVTVTMVTPNLVSADKNPTLLHVSCVYVFTVIQNESIYKVHCSLKKKMKAFKCAF